LAHEWHIAGRELFLEEPGLTVALRPLISNLWQMIIHYPKGNLNPTY